MVDRLDVALWADLQAAKRQILETAREREVWTAFDLKKAARRHWSASTMGLVLYVLLDEGLIERDSNYHVRLAEAAVAPASLVATP